jgi:hypothetical protein
LTPDVQADISTSLLIGEEEQPGPIVDRVFEIEFLASGAEGLAFTFG